MDLVKTNIAGFSKDKNSGLIVNTDNAAFEQIKAQRKRSRELKSLSDAIVAIQKNLAIINEKLGIKL